MEPSLNSIILEIVCKEIDKSIGALAGAHMQLTCDIYTHCKIKKEYSARIRHIKKIFRH